MSLKRIPGLTLYLLFGVLFLLNACGGANGGGIGSAAQTNSGIAVVAAENFYGDIVKQIGGSHVTVTSIISNADIDPHGFESNPKYVRSVGAAQLIVANGGGYDDWIDKLITSTPKEGRVVLKGFDLATTKLPANEHVWYSIANAQVIGQAIADNLKKLDSSNAADYDAKLQSFKQGLQPVQQKISDIKAKYTGTAVGLTETIFLYQTGPMGLDVKTPEAFQKAMAEGEDPPASAVATTEDQVKKRQIKVLIYNKQTTSKITETLQSDAQAQHIPVVPITETMPPGKTYQSWMLDQLTILQQGLGG